MSQNQLAKELGIWAKCVWPWLPKQSSDWLGYTAITNTGLSGQRSQVQVTLLSQCSYICHFLSTCTGTAFISVSCTHFISDLLTPEFYSPKPFSVPPVSWNGLKRNVDSVPLLLVTFPWILRPVEWSLNSSGRNWRFVHHSSQDTVPLLLSADASYQTNWSILLTVPKTHLSAVSTQPVPQLLPQEFAVFSLPTSPLSSPGLVQISPPWWSCPGQPSWQWVSLSQAHFLGSLD